MPRAPLENTDLCWFTLCGGGLAIADTPNRCQYYFGNVLSSFGATLIEIVLGKIHRVRILLSSPGNLSKDRKVAREVLENINLDSGAREGFVAELVTWETHTRPSVGEYSQAVINEQFPKDIDIFVGMMGSYFGTATPNWGSGTEEEFRIAYASHENDGVPDIMFYFSNAVTSLSEIDHEQLAKISKFQKDIGELGVYYRPYNNRTELLLLLHRQLAASIRKVVMSRNDDGYEGSPPDQSSVMLPNYSKMRVDFPEIVVEELFDDAVAHLSSNTKAMNAISRETLTFSKEINALTRSLSQAVQAQKNNKLEKAGTRFGKALVRYPKRLLTLVPEMRNDFEQSMLSVQRALLLRREYELEDLIPTGDLFDSARSLTKGFEFIRPGVSALNQSLSDGLGYIPEMKLRTEIIVSLHLDIVEYTYQAEKLIINLCEEFE